MPVVGTLAGIAGLVAAANAVAGTVKNVAGAVDSLVETADKTREFFRDPKNPDKKEDKGSKHQELKNRKKGERTYGE